MEGVSAQPSSTQFPFKRASQLINSRNLLLSIVVLLAISAIVLFILVLNRNEIVKRLQTSKEPTVSLTKDYDNPFDKSTQYVNPFSEYKNPFDELIK